MRSVILCANPLDGHMFPMLALARGLADRGTAVRLLTTAGYAERARQAGAVPVLLPPEAEIPPEALQTGRVAGRGRAQGFRGAVAATRRVMLEPMAAHVGALEATLRESPADAVLSELTDFGVGAFALRPRRVRPPVVACGITAVVLLSRDTAPPLLGLPPRSDALGRLRNRSLNVVVRQVALGGLHRDASRRARAISGTGFRSFFLDWARDADAYVQLGVPSFEYPRSDAPANLRYVGPLTAPATRGDPPPWWGDVAGGRPVVVVSQGTLANADPGELIRPTIEALAGDDVLVVALVGRGRDPAALGVLPGNARAAEYVDFARLLPSTAVMVTNGGYGSLLTALRHGVPVVAAGDTEDKVETCARVAWAGVGVNLRTGTPTPDAVRAATRLLLADGRYRRAAQRVAAEIASAPGVDGVVQVLDELAVSR